MVPHKAIQYSVAGSSIERKRERERTFFRAPRTTEAPVFLLLSLLSPFLPDNPKALSPSHVYVEGKATLGG